MKFPQVLLGTAILLSACSSPKYVYHFDHYDYNSGRQTEKLPQIEQPEISPLKINDETLVATSENHVIVSDPAKTRPDAVAVKEIAKQYQALSNSERKAFKKELKKEIKGAKKLSRTKNNVESIGATKEFDTTVSLAILFGTAGIVMTILASVSNVFWVLGAISLVIGAYFFIRWVANGNG